MRVSTGYDRAINGTAPSCPQIVSTECGRVGGAKNGMKRQEQNLDSKSRFAMIQSIDPQDLGVCGCRAETREA